MRVVSQDGRTDIPYESSDLWIKSEHIPSGMDGGVVVKICANTNGNQEFSVIGTYCSEKRAVEVLDMILCHYCHIKESEFLGAENAFFTNPFFRLPVD